MGCLGNLFWFLCGGALIGLSWWFTGLLWCLTIVGIPVGRQCFKLAKLAFSPFGKEIVDEGGSFSFLLNLIWIFISGLPLALEAVSIGLVLCLTIIGIPFGKQCFKIARLALMPFGARVIG